jgi:hypothetical protein
MRDFIIAARTMIEGDAAAGSVTAVARIVASEFSDPEGLFYLTRHLAHLNQAARSSGARCRRRVLLLSCHVE